MRISFPSVGSIRCADIAHISGVKVTRSEKFRPDLIRDRVTSGDFILQRPDTTEEKVSSGMGHVPNLSADPRKDPILLKKK
jgi:hypothetical protein